MNDNSTEVSGTCFLLICILILSSFGWYNLGSYYGASSATNKTTVECIEKPQLCKERYEFIKLGKKLGEFK